MNVPLSEPDITEREIEAVVRVLRGTQLSLGPELERFEASAAEVAGVPHAVAVSSGTAGLHLCVRALGIGPGDEVIVPSFTFIAAANAIGYEGATPVFADIDAGTLNVDPACVEAAITPRTRAIMAVHTFGLPAPMGTLLDLAQRHGLQVIEDACEAIGAHCEGRPVGGLGVAGVFAFYPNKQMTTGEGGMIVTRDAALARTARALRNQGRYPTDAWLQHSMVGFNYRMSEINAALGAVQIGRLGEMLARRHAVAERYDRLLAGIPGLVLPPRTAAPGDMSWFVYVVRLPAGADRDRVAARLSAAGVQCGRYFAPVHLQAAYGGAPCTPALPVTEAEARRTLALPFFNQLSEAQAEYVAGQLRAALEER